MALRRNQHWSSLAILATGLLSMGPTGILAQTTNATCQSSFNWMDNTLSQNPCLISAYLQAACNGGQFTVEALPPNSHYTGPYVNEANECQCSSVTYNTISACGICQGGTIITWSAWDTNCSVIYPGVFLPGIPTGTTVPAWAFQDVTTSNLFNATLAQSVGDAPESTASSVQSTGSVVATPTVSAPLTGSPSTSSTASPMSSSNTGAIAGGVVGGVVGVALIAGVVVFFVMRRKRSQSPPLAEFAGRPTSSVYPSPGYTDVTAFAPQMAQPKLYVSGANPLKTCRLTILQDPSDPSTFPTSPPPTTIGGSSNNIQNPTLNYSSQSVHPGYYSGAPEI
ncbi:hypothetical protein J3R82DRAFT_6043 [Butyriboletus roseoflavus]|nr:hypothetical protein J3R82DRAFT_6043 [Butyriboletus roseoflavus]